ncbi:MAG: amidohydrolase family protein [Candidatus Contendobacter sp.]|nr:MAG: amidohydrolase family protein [Candidatus Contendobacter sp.]
MMLNPDDMLIDAHVHVVPPGLPGLHGFPAVLDGAVATVAATVRADMAVSGTAQALAMGVLSDDPDDPLGVAATLRIADQVPGLHAIGVADPRRNEPEPLDRVEHQLRQGRIKGLKAYLGYLPHGPASPGYAPYYRLAARSQIPVIFHSGDTYAASAKLQYAHPLLIDEVAVDYPDTHFVIAHCGCPWFVDAAEVIYKNANVWADRSGLFVGDAAAFAALAARALAPDGRTAARGAGVYRTAGPVPVRQRLAAGPDGGVPGVSRPAAGRSRVAGAPGRQRPRAVSAVRERPA